MPQPEKLRERSARASFAYERRPCEREVDDKGSPLKRLRIGDFRVLFEETPSEIIIAKIGPRGSIYD